MSAGKGVTVRVPAKVNLDLSVGATVDGFHLLSTVFHAVDLVDEVTVRRARSWGISVTGEFAAKVPADDSNLALRVAHLMYDTYHGGCGITMWPVQITIKKAIPVAGGMAGGSADAAATILGINELFDLQLPAGEMAEIAAEVGSDVPFALVGGTALGSNRGDEVLPVLTTAKYEWVFAIHGEGLSTPTVFAKFDELVPEAADRVPTPNEKLLAALRSGRPTDLAPVIHNDLQDAAVALLPRLSETLSAGVDGGALASFVSGSGPTVAFLVENRRAALDLLVTLSAAKVADQLVLASSHPGGARVISTK
ncbi:4-(cytidine 5'-diphospho)-2-C-methyl-D-erythritol kinase [Calidifontibacter terrae]